MNPIPTVHEEDEEDGNSGYSLSMCDLNATVVTEASHPPQKVNKCNERDSVVSRNGVICVVLAIGLALSLGAALGGDKQPEILAVGIALGFVSVVVLFIVYDRALQSNQHQLLASNPTESSDEDLLANMLMESQPGGTSSSDLNRSGSTQIVKSMLEGLRVPNPRKFIFSGEEVNSQITTAALGDGSSDSNGSKGKGKSRMNGMSSMDSLKDFLGNNRKHGGHASFLGTDRGTVHQSKPLAELFTNTTIIFMDLVGFTAWSSVREPSQTFTLLETLFHAFDSISTRLGVFKVETIGDCYVAVTGLPKPRVDHAIVMARFANECLGRMSPLCKRLERTLGPDTSDLNLRVGLHSGQVTGGVLRGKRSRFQLFGATVNMAARIESTGGAGKIHMSHGTAELLKSGGHSSWVVQRPDQVHAKGVGTLQTYWLQMEDENKTEQSPTPHNGIITAENASPACLGVTHTGAAASKTEGLIGWMVDLLIRLLKQIVARRVLLRLANPDRKADANESIYESSPGQREGTLLDEVKESINMPSTNTTTSSMSRNAEDVALDPKVCKQIEDYVRLVAAMYNDNPFHSFEHACHVTMSVGKLLSRIVAPSSSEFDSAALGESLDDHTYGITSDPLTQFSCLLSALIHDAHHPGVPNAQLVTEHTELAEIYQNTSVAEQQSIDKCWSLLMEPTYKDLRNTIYTTADGLHRFRSLVVNSVLATDICDKQLKELRNNRWDKAFHKNGQGAENETEEDKSAKDRKATIVIEHLIQASDIAHTMQHWHVYRKWNERLFRECYKAYKEGRAEKDPSEYWYKGEIGFFDFYIIPLAKKLQECGVFGVSSSEYLDYALKNREEWELKGEEVVEQMKKNPVLKRYGPPADVHA